MFFPTAPFIGGQGLSMIMVIAWFTGVGWVVGIDRKYRTSSTVDLLTSIDSESAVIRAQFGLVSIVSTRSPLQVLV
jgi:hypothetical protein